MDKYDLIIIGGGSAGLVAAETSLLFKKKVAIVAIDKLGGDCLWSGCVPSKALLLVAKQQHLKGEKDPQKAYTIAKDQIKKSWEKIQSGHENPEWYQAKGIDVYLDGASFIDDHTVQVGAKQLKAKYFLIATGSRATVMPIPGIESIDYLTNENIFTLKKVPESIVIIGGGPIGCEIAQAMNHLGVKVTIIQHGNRLLSKDEPEASESILKQFTNEGIKVLFGTETNAVRKSDNGIALVVSTANDTKTLHVESLLLAAGRQPNVENLGLDIVGITYDKHGIKHNKQLQTNKNNIYVAGDVAGDYQFTHYAGVQAAAAIRNMFLPVKASFTPFPVSWCTFTTPEVAHTGISEAEAIEKKQEYRVISFPYNHIDRAVVEAVYEGFIKILVKPDNTVIGATVVGESAGEMIHELALAIHKKMKTDDLLSLMHVYPTYNSGIQQALFVDLLSQDSLKLKIGRLLAKLT